MNDDNQLTPDERQVLTSLSHAWEYWLRLPAQHPDHVDEFRHIIHAAQRMILSRPTSRGEGLVKEEFEPVGAYPSYDKPLPRTEGWPDSDALWRQVTRHMPTEEEKKKMGEDGYGVVTSKGVFGSVFPGVVQSPAFFKTEERAWSEAFLDWFVKVEVKRQVDKVMRHASI